MRLKKEEGRIESVFHWNDYDCVHKKKKKGAQGIVCWGVVIEIRMGFSFSLSLLLFLFIWNKWVGKNNDDKLES